MSMTTIHIPDKQATRLRESLIAIGREIQDAERAPGQAHRYDEVEALLRQIDTAPNAVERELTGSQVVLWNAVYDGLCVAAEQFAADCNEIWRGETDFAALRDELSELDGWLALLASLGAPPTEAL